MSLTFVGHLLQSSLQDNSQKYLRTIYMLIEKVPAVLEPSRLFLFKFLGREKSNSWLNLTVTQNMYNGTTGRKCWNDDLGTHFF